MIDEASTPVIIPTVNVFFQPVTIAVLALLLFLHLR